MDAKLKAKELVEKFRAYGGDYRTGDRSSIQNAKQCALIAVDEILDILKKVDETRIDILAWQKVKKEISTL